MTQDAKSWPDKPGFPMNPSKSGWHWLSWQGGEPRAWEYDAELNPYGVWRSDEGNLGAWIYHEPLRYGATGMQTPYYMVSNGWRYLGPCLPPETTNTLISACEDALAVEIEAGFPDSELAGRLRAALAKAKGE